MFNLNRSTFVAGVIIFLCLGGAHLGYALMHSPLFQ